ncbi:MAG TPA: Flp pilus assembly protein CpaB [Ideonella sp.]|uniref:Flp pilus assembly protein CpaB n=1 Tax=Ideonella sp. TaxID=1929293 RepID=UPI002BE70C38|nr:Flp pilus assembly protein CpaB [Ideonella sp.]HSI48228.1 Flp pilus assembly protein CpaB [Ideonella sp.]
MAISIPKVNTNWLLLAGAIALGVGAVFLSNSLIKRRLAEMEDAMNKKNETVEVVVAKRDLERGELLSGDVVAVRQIPKQYAHDGGVKPDQFDAFENQRLAVPVKRGEEVLAVHTEGAGTNVFSSALKKGSRALTFEVDAVNSISGMLRPGDHIDLIYTARGTGDGPDVTLPLLSNVPVLATDQTLTKRDDGTGKERSFTTVTMEVSPVDANRIIVAKSSGQLTAVLRHPDDVAANGTRTLSARMLVAGAGKDGVRTVEYIVGGGSGGRAEVQLAQLAPALNRAAGAQSGNAAAH